MVNEEQSQDCFAVISADPAHSVLQNVHYVHSKHEKARPEIVCGCKCSSS